MNFEVPNGLTELLQDFTVEVLRRRPSDLLAFAARYFEELIEKRSKSQLGNHAASHAAAAAAPGAARHQQSVNDDDEDEENHEDEEDDDICDMPDLPKHMRPGTSGAASRRHSVAAEKYNPEEDTSDEPLVSNPKSDDERDFLRRTMSQIFIFRSLESQQVEQVIDAMFCRHVETGDMVIEQGDDGDNFYVIESGTYDISVNKQRVASYEEKGSFGELALMYNQPRAATVQAKTVGKLWALDRLTFRRIVLKSAFEKRKMYEQLLENMPMFKSLSAYERMNVADALFSRTFADGAAIIEQGDKAACMYFLESGSVRVVRDQDGQSKELKRCGPGDYFGELALLTKKPRAATAYALGDNVRCAILEVDAFERLLGPCIHIMQQRKHDYDETLRSLFGDKFSVDDLA